MMKEIELSPDFSPITRERYTRSLELEHRRRFEHEMQLIRRWQQDKSIRELVDGMIETNLDHIHAFGRVSADYRMRAPHLAKEVNFDVVGDMGLIHDVGEIAIGDWPAIGELRESLHVQRLKTIEPYFVLRFIRKYVTPTERNYAWGTYLRYTRKRLNDRESMMANFIDKALAVTRTGMEYVYNPARKGHLITSELRERHIKGVRKMMTYALPLMRSLSSEARIEFEQIVAEELQRLINNGFGEELGNFLNGELSENK